MSLVNPDTGEVYNDYHRDNSYKRLYNAPWYARLYIEFFNLWQKEEYLETACKILRFYYAEGGSRFYPIQMPVAELIPLLRSNGLTIQADALMAAFLHHADYLAANETITRRWRSIMSRALSRPRQIFYCRLTN